MDRFVNKKIEKQTIYEIYRACRLCGAGGGYKMPIIQNVVNIEGCDVELKQKIRECVQIEVHQNDRMPPLICELCVDKVNDFYEFLEMCRQTNKRTRLRLGLPPQMMPRGAPDAGDCILGVTEPIYVNDEDSNEPLSDKKTKITRRVLDSKIKKEPEKEKKDNKIKIGTTPLGRQCRSVRVRQPTPPSDRRRDKKEKNADNTTLSKLQHSKSKRAASPPPKSILKRSRDIKKEESPVSQRLKRLRDKDAKPELPAKRVKIAAKPSPRPVKPEPKALHPCLVCKQKLKTPQAVISHLRSHTVGFTDPKCACNACGAWFPSVEETAAHHKRHTTRCSPYVCRHCGARYKQLHSYDTHASKCVQYEEVPDVECPKCWKAFPTQNLLDKHRCPGESGRKGGKCSKCSRSYMTRKSLVRHERGCTKGKPIIDPEVQSRLKPLQVRVAKCDPLLANTIGEHYDVSSVKADFGLDKKCVYPYIASRLRIKSEPSDCMVKINDLDFASYVHWDSEDDSGDSDTDNMDGSLFTKPRKVESLTACALKTIFSKKFLGKVPRKFRRIKIENIINSALNDSLSDLNINEDLNKHNSFNADDSGSSVKSSDISGVDNHTISDRNYRDKTVTDDEDDSLFPKENVDSKVTNDCFDSLFNKSSEKGENNDSSVSLDDKLDGKINDENGFNDSEDLVRGKSKLDENHLTDSQDDKINNSELDSTLKTEIEEGKVEDSNHNQGVELNFKENNNYSENNKSNESIKFEKNIDENEINDEQKQLTIEHSTKKYTSETTKEASQDSTEHKEVSDTEIEGTNKVEETVKQDEENGKVAKSTLKESESDTTGHTVKSKSIQENSNEHSVGNTDITTDKQDNIEVKENSLFNGVSVDDDNLNMDDLEDWGDEDLDDHKLMADLDEQIGEKNAGNVKETVNTKNTKTIREKETEDTETKDTANAKNVSNSVEKANFKKETNEKEKGNKKSILEEDIKVNEDLKMEAMDVDTDKITLDDLLPKKDSEIGRMDCENISDTEFNFD